MSEAALPVVPARGGIGARGEVLLDRHRVYIFPTRHGWVFGAALCIMVMGATNYANSLAFMLTFLLAGLALVGILHTYRNLAGLRFTGARCAPVFAGEQARFQLYFDNRAAPARFALGLERHPRVPGRWWRRRPRPTENGAMVDLGAGELATVSLAVPARRRGRLRPGRIRIASTYPLGLLRTWAYIEVEQDCVVYPVPAGERRLPPPSTDDRRRHHSGTQHGTDDFRGFRAYHPGDSPRYIAWKAFARGGELMVKRFAGSGADALVLGWRHVEHLRDVEARLSQLCRWVLEADRAGIPFGLDLPGALLAPAQGEAHRERCLQALALHGYQ
jgi:uncharacterized protein (DUF58 family)